MDNEEKKEEQNAKKEEKNTWSCNIFFKNRCRKGWQKLWDLQFSCNFFSFAVSGKTKHFPHIFKGNIVGIIYSKFIA